jgi:hypothetical protein
MYILKEYVRLSTTGVKLMIVVLILGATMAEKCVYAEYKLKFDPRRARG